METFLSVFEHTAGVTAGIFIGLVGPTLAVLVVIGLVGGIATLISKIKG